MSVNNDKIPFDSEHHGETGARKYLAGAASEDLYLAGAAREDLQDGISRGGTETGDPSDRPPELPAADVIGAEFGDEDRIEPDHLAAGEHTAHGRYVHGQETHQAKASRKQARDLIRTARQLAAMF